MKKENIALYTKHVKDKIDAHRDIITASAGEKRAELLFNQLDIVVDLSNQIETLLKNESTLESNKKILKDEEITIQHKAQTLYDLGYKTISVVKPELLTIYFDKITPSSLKGKTKLLKKSLKRALTIIENPEYDHLNDYNEKYENSIKEIGLFMTKKEEFLSNIESVSEKLNNLIDEWKIDYSILKLDGNAALKRGDYDHKELFLDLGVSKPKKTKKKIEGITPEDKIPNPIDEITDTKE